MSRLQDHSWRVKYSADDGDLIAEFYIPALACAVRYDRTTGYFSADTLTLALRGIEGLVRNEGHMRLIVGCTLDAPEVAAIERGLELRDAIAQRLLTVPLAPTLPAHAPALELLAWLVAHGILEVKVAVPCDAQRCPLPGPALFHEKSGILEDQTGAILAFSGSLNETAAGWQSNWESFHVYTGWSGGVAHIAEEEKTFARLWNDQAQRALVVPIPDAVRQNLLRFLPPDGQLPQRLQQSEEIPPLPRGGGPEGRGGLPSNHPGADAPPLLAKEGNQESERIDNPRQVIWSFLHRAPALPNGGERIGEATSAVQPWPHQIRAFQRMYDAWPPRLLIADEVGLGKTIQAGLVLRQAWLAGKAQRILILAPKAVLQQWQIELREKFNLNWPIYDGQKLHWHPSPGLRALQSTSQAVSRQEWHRRPAVLASSQLMRRADRAPELLNDAEPWDLIILDEAHHARRKGGGLSHDNQPNQLLRLMRQLRQRTAGLILLTATPMQISPVEVWDLLALLGLPPTWELDAFLRFFELAAAPLPHNQQLAQMAELFRAAEAEYGAVSTAIAQTFMPGQSRLKAGKVLNILRAASQVAFNSLESDERRAAVQLMKAYTPLRRLISRHTRPLLRRYHQAGKLPLRIADRQVTDRFVTLTPAERSVYDAVEDYIATTYQNAADTERTAVGFVMTIYRRRLASSFHALHRTLEKRLAATRGDQPDLFAQDVALAEDVLDDDIAEDAMDADDAAQLEQAALNREEQSDIERLLGLIRALPPDTKAGRLLAELQTLRAQGYPQAMIFTQYTDTLDFLRELLVTDFGAAVLCFSGRGGEIRDGAGWRVIARDDIKQRFRAGQAEILLCTDAAAEGLNFQFCGALLNYDMPWNPMRVEQRIGRIDRLGQQFPVIRIVNLHYEDTVETDVYLALRERIQLFETFVGRLQPILAKLPGAFAQTALQDADQRQKTRHDLLDDLKRDLEQPAPGGLDLDEVTEAALEMPPRPPALYDLQDLGRLLKRPELLPPGIEVAKTGGKKDRAWQQPGMLEAVRVTTDPVYYEEHADSVELWSPGNPLFPSEPLSGEIDYPTEAAFRAVLTGPASSYPAKNPVLGPD